MALTKVVDEAQVNDDAINAQDSMQFVDKDTGSLKRKFVDENGQVQTQAILGPIRAGVQGRVQLLAGRITVNIVVFRSLKTVSIVRFVPGGDLGFPSVEILIPGGPGVPAQFEIVSSSNTDTSEFDFIAFEENA